MKTKFVFLINFLIFLIMVIPLFVYAGRLVPCSSGQDCNFGKLMDLVNNIIKFVLFDLAMPIAAIMFAYGGFKMISAGGESAQARETAKSIFSNVAIGLAYIAGSWLIVRTILSILGFDGSWIGF